VRAYGPGVGSAVFAQAQALEILEGAFWQEDAQVGNGTGVIAAT